MDNTPLIIGAGPTGLAAALFLAKQGVKVRIIDAAPSPSPYSRALAVNPRTLELLEPTGVTEKMLQCGMPMREVHFRRDNKPLADISLHGIKHRYPFLLALSQASTEKLLTEALQELGTEVERGSKLTACSQESGIMQASIETAGNVETFNPAWLFAADGAHSVVRSQLGLDFAGSSFAETWYLADVPLKTDLKLDGYVWFFDKGGFLFLIPVIEDIRKGGNPIWRVIANFPNLLDRIPDAEPSGAPIWESSFHVSHRMVSKMKVGNIYLAGDAAHIHSPIGARGMNLGIEDAWTFAELFKAGKLERYGKLRERIDGRVVKRVKMLTIMARGQNPITRLARRTIFPLVPRIPFLYTQMVNTASGLDHLVEL
jgi:2-polyprenyl-6-methoxyphenol hydroxylase-like FAD-dependent oxidoreductase